MQYRIAAYVFLVGTVASIALSAYCFSLPVYVYIGDNKALTPFFGGWAAFMAFLTFCGARYCSNRAASRPAQGVDFVLFLLAKVLMVTLVLLLVLWWLCVPTII